MRYSRLRRAAPTALALSLVGGLSACPASGAYSYSISRVRVTSRGVWVRVLEERPRVVPELSKRAGISTRRTSSSRPHDILVTPASGACRRVADPPGGLGRPVAPWFRERDPRLRRVAITYGPSLTRQGEQARYLIGPPWSGGPVVIHYRAGAAHAVVLADRVSGAALAELRLPDPPTIVPVDARAVLVQSAAGIHLLRANAGPARPLRCDLPGAWRSLRVRARRGLPLAVVYDEHHAPLALLDLASGACLTREAFEALPRVVSFYRAGGSLLAVEPRVGVLLLWRVGPDLRPRRVARISVVPVAPPRRHPSGEARLKVWRLEPTGSFWATVLGTRRHLLVHVDARTGRVQRIPLVVRRDPERRGFRPLCAR